MCTKTILRIFLVSSAYRADKLTAPQLVDLAKSNSAGLQTAILATFDANDLTKGTAWAARGSDFFFVTESATEPKLIIDGAAGPAMQLASGGKHLWYAAARIRELGKLHSFYYLVNGAQFGGRLEFRRSDPFLISMRPRLPACCQVPQRIPGRSTTA